MNKTAAVSLAQISRMLDKTVSWENLISLFSLLLCVYLLENLNIGTFS